MAAGDFFADRVVLITGASSGIGAALARELARRGAHVVLAARRAAALAALAAEIERGGRRALAVAADVTHDGDLELAAARARQTLGRIDVVVANAGFGVVGPLERLTLADYRRQLETNVFGVLRTVYATLEDLKQARGRLCIVGSVSGYLSIAGSSPYAMSKYAVRALAESLWYELAPHGVAVTLVTAGYVDSDIRRTDNRGVVHPAAPDPIPAWLRMPAPSAARRIADAVARGRREVVITGHGKLAVFFARHAPWLVAAVVRRVGIRNRPEPTGT